MNDYGKVAVLLGGASAEREISLRSGRAVLAALVRRGVDAHTFDPAERPLAALAQEGFARVFIALHGRGGEDGTVQGALELLRLPYTGSGVLASALAMDKWRSKLVWQAAGLPVPPWRRLEAGFDAQEVVAAFGLPLFVKPANEGSSLGISRVESADELPEAWWQAAGYDCPVLVERGIAGPEVQFPILNGAVLPSIRIEPATAFYDYQAKYFRDDTRYHCPGLPPDEEVRLHPLVLEAFRVLGCEGWGRMDLMLDADGTPYLLEMNTVPGMTDHSLVPMAAAAAGLGFDDLVLQILDGAHVG